MPTEAGRRDDDRGEHGDHEGEEEQQRERPEGPVGEVEELLVEGRDGTRADCQMTLK